MSRSWKEELKCNINTIEELENYIPMNSEEKQNMKEIIEKFPMSIPRYYMSLMNQENPDDPIRKMAVPSHEALDLNGFLDTSGEGDNTIMPGLQHKYQQTVLVLTTNQCAMYCRHCFRRRLVGLTDAQVSVHMGEMAEYIKAHPMINNVLLSGGDFLLNDNSVIEKYLHTFGELEQLDFIRMGSRTPVTFPYRITWDKELLAIFQSFNHKKQLYLVTHFNHPSEITEEAKEAIRCLQEVGVVVKNQTVLLQGVNDDVEVLAKLLQMLSAIGVIPHYIFQCRPVLGMVNRFQVPIRKGVEVVYGALAKQNGLGKSADYVMSHHNGKIRILGTAPDGEVCFQYKQAKDPENINKIFTKYLDEDEKWLDI